MEVLCAVISTTEARASQRASPVSAPCPDEFCRLNRLGLSAMVQQVQPDRTVLVCRIIQAYRCSRAEGKHMTALIGRSPPASRSPGRRRISDPGSTLFCEEPHPS